MASRARVAIIGTGGTISFRGRDNLDRFEYMDHAERQGVAEIVAQYPEIAVRAELELHDHLTLSSSGVTPDDWLTLLRAVHEVANAPSPPDGIVVTHGTASLEETAYFLGLTVKVDTPVVMVGAQRPTGTLGTDAGSNLVGAVQVAAAPESRGMGVLSVLNDEIQPARDVTKTSTLRLQTFRSVDAGPIGFADPDGRVVYYRRPHRIHAPDTEFDVAALSTLPRVDVAYTYGGADGAAIAAFVQAGAAGIVVAGFAPGMVTPAQEEAIADAIRAGVLVVQGSRAGGGRVIQRTRLREQGIVAADNLNPQKARVLAMLSLTRDFALAERSPSIQRLFDTY